MGSQGFLVHLVERRMEGGEQGRLVPAVRRDLPQHIVARESLGEEPSELENSPYRFGRCG